MKEKIIAFPTALEIKRRHQPLSEAERVARNVDILARQNSEDLYVYMVANDPACRKRREEKQRRHAQERQRREQAVKNYETLQHSLFFRVFGGIYLRKKEVKA